MPPVAITRSCRPTFQKFAGRVTSAVGLMTDFAVVYVVNSVPAASWVAIVSCQLCRLMDDGSLQKWKGHLPYVVRIRKMIPGSYQVRERENVTTVTVCPTAIDVLSSVASPPPAVAVIVPSSRT